MHCCARKLLTDVMPTSLAHFHHSLMSFTRCRHRCKHSSCEEWGPRSALYCIASGVTATSSCDLEFWHTTLTLDNDLESVKLNQQEKYQGYHLCDTRTAVTVVAEESIRSLAYASVTEWCMSPHGIAGPQNKSSPNSGKKCPLARTITMQNYVAIQHEMSEIAAIKNLCFPKK